MNTSKGDVLTQAYDLIEADQLDEARAILKPVLDSDKDNADAWWLYAHAVSDPETARLALNNVLRLDNEYPEAAELLKTLDQQSPAIRPLETQKEPSFLPAVPATIPDLPESEGAGVAAERPRTSQEGTIFSHPAFLIAVFLIVIILATIIVVLHPFGNSTPTATATQSVAEAPTLPIATSVTNSAQTVPTLGSSPAATLESTATSEGEVSTSEGVSPTSEAAVPTEGVAPTPEGEAPTSESVNPTIASGTPSIGEGDPTASSATSVATTGAPNNTFSDLKASLSSFTLSVDNGIAITPTSQGSTLLVTVCTMAGREMRTLLPQVMDALAKASGNYTSQVEYVGVHMMDCTANSNLLTIGASVSDASAYANGTLSEADFQARWKPLT